MRVGVNTGEVVVRSIRKDDLHTDYVPVGHSTNLAARMEQMATPGSILITEYTQKLVEGYFELKALGAAEIKGVEEPLPVYEVLGAGPLRTRLQVSARRGLTRFVGRQSEMEQLQRALGARESGTRPDRRGDGRAGVREVAPVLRIRRGVLQYAPTGYSCFKPTPSPMAKRPHICR